MTARFETRRTGSEKVVKNYLRKIEDLLSKDRLDQVPSWNGADCVNVRVKSTLNIIV